MRRNVVGWLRKQDAFAVENPAWPGTPDVNYKEGWIELKWAKHWPARDGILSIDHFTKQQRFFLQNRWYYGGNVWLLLNVARDWMLFDGDVAAREVGYHDRESLAMFARSHWVGQAAIKTDLHLCLSR
jgi:hypothetical protein